MSYNIKKELIPDLPRKSYRRGTGKPEGVVLHDTGAWNGTAESNRLYEGSTWGNAFVHFFVDWDSIVQVADTDYLCWGCGYIGNQRFVQIELVRTKDKDKFVESYKRYVWLVAKMLHEYGLEPKRLDTLWTHHDITKHLGGTTHTDPDAYLEYHGYTVDQLISDIEKAYSGNVHHVDVNHKVDAAQITRRPCVVTGDVWLHSEANFDKSTELRVLEKGDEYWVYGEKNGMYDLGQHQYASKKYIKIIDDQKSIPYPGYLFEFKNPMIHGEKVKEIQKELNKHGANLTVDGWYGQNTKDAVEQFQKNHGLSVDGIVGEHTWSKLFG